MLRYTKVLPEHAEAAARRTEEGLGDLDELDEQPGVVVKSGCHDAAGGQE